MKKNLWWMLWTTIFSILIGAIFLNKVYGAEPVLQVMDGQTLIEDMTHPDGSEIEEAERYLSENHVYVPADIEALCINYGKKYNIAPELLEAMIWKESRFQPDVVDASGTCKGLMQISVGSHKNRMQRLGVTDLHDPESNIAVGADYLHELLVEYDLETAIMLYNGDKRAEQPGYLSGYAKKVLAVSQALERSHFK